jgi:hypothetical protein
MANTPNLDVIEKLLIIEPDKIYRKKDILQIIEAVKTDLQSVSGAPGPEGPINPLSYFKSFI